MKAQLKDGFEIEIKDNSLNDWRFLKTLRKIDKGDAALIVDAAEYLLGEDGLEALEKHIEKDGFVPTDGMASAITELMESVNELKNS